MAYTIMIIDDSETIRSVLKRAFALAKLPVDAIIQAVNGRDALEKLEHSYVDIVFTDINMPEMDGVALIETMNAHPEYQDIPVIVVSTEGSSTRIANLQSKGIKGYIRKPFTPEKLRDIIIATLGAWDT